MQTWALCHSGSVLHTDLPVLLDQTWASALFSRSTFSPESPSVTHADRHLVDSTLPNFQACPHLSDGHIKWTYLLQYVREASSCSSIRQNMLLMKVMDLSTSVAHCLCKEHHAFPMFCHINSDNNRYRKRNTDLPSPNLIFRLRSVSCELLWESGLGLLRSFIIHKMKEIVWIDF